jgi:hypothetical protein
MRKTLKIKLNIGIVLLFLCLSFAVHSAAVYLREFTFDDENPLDKWQKMILNGEVDYTLVRTGNESYIKAFSEKTCSALYYRIGFRLRDYPILTWKWNVLQFPDISAARTEEEKDDYAARIYVILPFLNFSTSKFLEYVWAEDIPVGTIIDSPSGNNVKIVVARSGKAGGREWVAESRNVYEDYIKAFGKKPNMKVRAIAIMCDADSTETSAESLFDDIVIEGQKGL